MSNRFRNFPFLSATILGALILRLWFRGFSGWGMLAFSATCLWFSWELIQWLIRFLERPKAPRSSAVSASPRVSHSQIDESSPLVSLVYFLSEPRQVDERGIRRCIEDALKREVGANAWLRKIEVIQPHHRDLEENGDRIRHFSILLPDGEFAVLASNQPYMKNPDVFASESIRDKRLRKAVETHQAWISVDLIDLPHTPEEEAKFYRIMGKILAAMAGPDCLAIYCPAIERCNEFDLSLLEILKGENPLSLFETSTFEPVIEIADNNPRLAAAVAEAVERWPEFVSAFEKSTSENKKDFIVKLEFREGRKAEFMWISIQKIEGEVVTGVLLNDPHELLNIHRGSTISANIARLSDWLYPGKGGQHVGGFTLDVLTEDDEQQDY